MLRMIRGASKFVELDDVASLYGACLLKAERRRQNPHLNYDGFDRIHVLRSAQLRMRAAGFDSGLASVEFSTLGATSLFIFSTEPNLSRSIVIPVMTAAAYLFVCTNSLASMDVFAE